MYAVNYKRMYSANREPFRHRLMLMSYPAESNWFDDKHVAVVAVDALAESIDVDDTGIVAVRTLDRTAVVVAGAA